MTYRITSILNELEKAGLKEPCVNYSTEKNIEAELEWPNEVCLQENKGTEFWTIFYFEFNYEKKISLWMEKETLTLPEAIAKLKQLLKADT